MKEIFERRSIRKYQNAPVPYDLAEQVIKAGMAAPSAGNEQPWEFVVVDDREILEGITKVHPHARMLFEAPAAIIVCSNMSLLRYDDGLWVQDCSAATENMLLEAAHLGLGAVWLGVYPMEERVKGIQALLQIPENIIPFSVISLGYPAENPPPADRYDPKRIHRNAW